MFYPFQGASGGNAEERTSPKELSDMKEQNDDALDGLKTITSSGMERMSAAPLHDYFPVPDMQPMWSNASDGRFA